MQRRWPLKPVENPSHDDEPVSGVHLERLVVLVGIDDPYACPVPIDVTGEKLVEPAYSAALRFRTIRGIEIMKAQRLIHETSKATRARAPSRPIDQPSDDPMGNIFDNLDT